MSDILTKIIKQEVKKILNEDSSWKRFLDPYTYFKSKNSFQYRETKFTKDMLKDLIKYSKENGYTVEQEGESVYAYNDESLKIGDGQQVWNYWSKSKELYYGNPNMKNKDEFVDIINNILFKYGNN